MRLVTVNAQLNPRKHADRMPLRPAYKICPGDCIEVGIVQPHGGRALVVGKLDAVPEAASGKALRIRVCDAQVRALPAR